MDNIKEIFTGYLDSMRYGIIESDPVKMVSDIIELGKGAGDWGTGEFEVLEERDLSVGKETVFLISLTGIRGADSCFFRLNVKVDG